MISEGGTHHLFKSQILDDASSTQSQMILSGIKKVKHHELRSLRKMGKHESALNKTAAVNLINIKRSNKNQHLTTIDGINPNNTITQAKKTLKK